MFKQIKILIILTVLFLNFGCSERKFTNISDCERIKDNSEKDKCFINIIENISLNNIELKVNLCNKIIDTEMKDLCLFKTVREGLSTIRSVALFDNTCNNISNDLLRDSCISIKTRGHLQIK